MAAILQNVTMHQGNDFQITIAMTSAVTGATAAKWGLFQTPTTITATLTKLLNAGLTISGDGLTITIALAAADTNTLLPSDYYHECEVTTPSTGKKTVMTGFFALLPTAF